MEDNIIGYDLNTPAKDGMDNITTALRELLNKYPSLGINDEITFQVLDATTGKAMFPTSSVAIIQEVEDVTEHVTQTCIYSFLVVYRASGLNENKKANVKEWLDNLGRWLQKETISINGTDYKLKSYPTLTSNREFTKIARTSQSYLYNTTEDKSEDWAISIQATYTNEFDRD